MIQKAIAGEPPEKQGSHLWGHRLPRLLVPLLAGFQHCRGMRALHTQPRLCFELCVLLAAPVPALSWQFVIAPSCVAPKSLGHS